MSVTRFLRAAALPPVVRRALTSAAIVGPVLIAINHGTALIRGQVTTGAIVRMALTLVVPYCVSTVSSVQAGRAGRREHGSDRRL